jgi:Ca2+-binding RTX toxin-like protein
VAPTVEAQTTITAGSADSKIYVGQLYYKALGVWLSSQDLGVCGYNTSTKRYEYRGSVVYDDMQDEDYVVTLKATDTRSQEFRVRSAGLPIDCYTGLSANRRITTWNSNWDIGLTFDMSDSSYWTIVEGSDKDDIIHASSGGTDGKGNYGDDVFYGGEAYDDFLGGSGVDRIYGHGSDTYDYFDGGPDGALIICAGFETEGNPTECDCDGADGYMIAESGSTSPGGSTTHYVIGCDGDDDLTGNDSYGPVVLEGGSGYDDFTMFDYHRAFSGVGGGELERLSLIDLYNIEYFGNGNYVDDVYILACHSCVLETAGGNDLVYLAGDDSIVEGGAGDDTIRVTGDNIYVTGDSGDDHIELISHLDGGIICGDSWNVLYECTSEIGDGADTIEGRADDIIIAGGGGCDTIDIDADSLSVYLGGGTFSSGDSACDSVNEGDYGSEGCARCTCDNGTYVNCEDMPGYNCSTLQEC